MNTQDLKIGGRILFEFQVYPPDIEDLDIVVLDITRQKSGITRYVESGQSSEAFTYTDAFGTANFWFPCEVNRDNEEPNDDFGIQDENNIPNDSDMIYSFDAPGSTQLSSPSRAIIIAC